MRPVIGFDIARAVPVAQSSDRRGRRSAETRAKLYWRDAMLAEADLVFTAKLSACKAAKFLHQRMLSYHRGAWRRHRMEVCLPPSLLGRVEELFWNALVVHDALPAERTIRFALDKGRRQRAHRHKGLFPA